MDINLNDPFLPHDLQSEQAILGSILLDSKIMDAVMAEIKSNVFLSLQHRKIFKAMTELRDGEKPVDLILLTERLQKKGWLDDVGGVQYLSELADSQATAANIGYYIQIAKEKHTLREMMRLGSELSSGPTEETTKAIDMAQSKLESLREEITPRKQARKIGEILRECYDDIEHKYTNRDGTGVTGIPSGYDDLDRLTGGFQDDDLLIVGARPSVGKTAFALNVGRNSAERSGKTVAIFSLEMSEKQLVGRMISAESNIDGNLIRAGHILGEDWERLTMAIGRLDTLPIMIDDTPDASVAEIRSKCRLIRREHGLGLVLIDYLQLIECYHRSGINRQQEITEISRALKVMAKELHVPVIALSQLSRAVEQRQDKRPMLSDLRDSGSIEQDADIVAFLYRDDYYNAESEKKNIIEIIIAKQRNGPIGTVELAFLKNFNKFVDLERGSHPEPSRAKKSFVPDMYRKP